MLEEVTIKNFAIIEELTVRFTEGLTVLTGETGAGKSIIIDAIGLLIGGRGSVDYVRHGESRAEIEGLFHLDASHPAREVLEQTGIEMEEDMLILRRDITNKGKSICRINGKLVTLAVLRQVGQSLVDIHGQHEHQDLMQQEKHLSVLDSYAGNKLRSTYKDYLERYRRFSKLKNDWRKWQENDQETANRLDFIRYQFDEIEKAELVPGEDEELEKEKHILANGEKLYTQIGHAYESLYGEGRGLDWAGLAVNHAEEAASIDEDMNPILESLQTTYYTLEEATFSLREKMDAISFDPERLNEIEARLEELKKLKRKYGDTVTDILAFASRLEEEVESLSNKEEKLEEMEKELHETALDLQAEADTLTDLRKQAGEKLVEDVKQQLQDLFMENAAMEVRVTPASSGVSYEWEHGRTVFNENGQDNVEFLMAANAGEPLKPLSKTASGGELSRIMLALKTLLSGYQNVTSIIFDEVDTGVSGRVAQAIAEKIYNVSTGAQVLCISHLPQVAAMADTNLYIEKKEQNDRVTTNIKPLEDSRKTDEIARMISGVEVTELTRDNANELLSMAEKIKTNS
ncbi:DNA repair protein RecN [Salibacterium halotolerans]|uniref:DNA repair protein RecN n=1 Tax=Salibacterium halotolerans TaxID=1884432 RepID=A0A1I5NPS7_9BACI|nr:DNA repair protein RecN [Salibacterium halotolerans]SFP23784.1 DNA repair protein RecN (Recombination protein N) [Salibacterium halotolerans]